MCKLVIVFVLIFFYKSLLAQNSQVFTSGKNDTAFVKFTMLGDTSLIRINLSHYYFREKRQDSILYLLKILNKSRGEKPSFIYIGRNAHGKTYQQFAKPIYDQTPKTSKDFSKLAVEIIEAFGYGGKVKEACFTGYKLEKNYHYNKLSFTLIPKLGLSSLKVNIEGDIVDSSFKETYKLNTINNVEADLYFKRVCSTQKK